MNGQNKSQGESTTLEEQDDQVKRYNNSDKMYYILCNWNKNLIQAWNLK